MGVVIKRRNNLGPPFQGMIFLEAFELAENESFFAIAERLSPLGVFVYSAS